MKILRSHIEFYLSLFVFLSCNSNQSSNTVKKDSLPFSKNLYSVILNYQQKYPINQGKKENRYYVYEVVFQRASIDTLISIGISPSGAFAFQEGILYGVYSNIELKPIIIRDSKEFLSKSFLNKPIRDSISISAYIPKDNKNYPESFPPIYNYKVRGNNLLLTKIDTVWTKWN